MTTPEEVKAVSKQLGYYRSSVEQAPTERFIQAVIEALDKVRGKHHNDQLERERVLLVALEHIAYPDTGKSPVEIARNALTVWGKPPAPLPDLQVGDRFTWGSNQWTVNNSWTDSYDKRCWVDVSFRDGARRLSVQELVEAGATDFKRPVWEPVPTK